MSDNLCNAYNALNDEFEFKNARLKIKEQENQIKELKAENERLKEKYIKDFRASNILNQAIKLQEGENTKAIETLEKVKDKIYDLNIGDYYLQNGGSIADIKVKRAQVYEVIDQLISGLKGKK